MVSSNKVLTVSYGTFSCTLEGFDDSFGTMKAIAEYFRNLAADDRYFGAEPPTPDADMLARIAEREISRRVQAHEEGGQIVLRASEGAAGPVADTAQADDDTAQAAAAGPEPAAAAGQAASAPPQSPSPDSAGQIAAPAPAAQASARDTDQQTQGAAPASEGGDRIAMTDQPPASAKAETRTEDADAEADDWSMVVPTDAAKATDQAEDEEADSVAARLRRIRSVVAQGGGSYGADDYDEDDPAQDFLSRTATELDAALETDARADADSDDDADAAQEALFADMEDAPEEPSGDASQDMSAEDPFADFTARLLQAEADDRDAARDDEAPAEDLPKTAPQEAEPVSEKTTSEPAAAPEGETDTAPVAETAPAQEPAPEGAPPAVPEGAAEDTLAQLLADALPDDADAEESTAKPAATRAGGATAEGEQDRLAEDADAEAGPAENIFETAPDAATDRNGRDADEAEAALSPEEEAELLQELAAVEAELGPQSAEAAALEDDAAPEPALQVDPAAAFTDAGDDLTESPENETGRGTAQRQAAAQTDSDVSRLFDEADSQLESPETSKRRNAIQHLRAAVAATRAEKKAGQDMGAPRTSDAAYRSDLESVVRPRRLRGAGSEPTERSRGQRPGAEHPMAPLKLVAEQRVDTPSRTVRPRRVSTAQLAAGTDTTGEAGFAAYAESIGAESLPDLLEAAAAYLADVEGRDQFSRPMLMGKLKEIGHESFSREDGLRSFGHLLRQGKLRKLKGGRFAVTDQTEFRDRARHAG